MYSDSIKVANKIISYNDLLDIFNKMFEDIEKYKKISKNEELRNQPLDYNYQKWTFKDNSSELRFTINFYDDTQIKFDNYNQFVIIFNNRLEEIKDIYVYYKLSYASTNLEGKLDYHHQNITMWIYENKMDLNFSLESNDQKMEEVYELIKTKIWNAPEKYDNVIKNKSSIIWNTGIAIGFIPAFLICTLLFMFVPTIRTLFCMSYVLYPICCGFITLLLASMIGSNKLEDLYQNIIPEKKYVSYEKGYKDDIEKYTTTSEILIGKNVHNLEKRKQIMNIYEKYKKYIPYEIIALIIFSIIVVIIGYFST